MEMHIPSRIDIDWSDVATLTSKSETPPTPSSPATRSDILGIFQREQDHAMFLLSLSPLLSSLFVSYANRTTSLRSASSTLSLESDKWKTFQKSITALREENEKLRSENRDIVLKLEAAQASQHGFRLHISSLEQVKAARQSEIDYLRKELVESKDLYERVIRDCNAEKAAHQTRSSGIEVQLVELKQTVAEKEAKVSKPERQLSNENPPARPIRQTPPHTRSRSSPTPNEATAISRVRPPPPEGCEETSRPSSASIRIREMDASATPPGFSEITRPQPLPRAPLPPPKPQPQPHQQKTSRGGWLKALNDTF